MPSGKASLLLRSRTFTCNGSSARLVRVMGSSGSAASGEGDGAGRDLVDRLAELVELLVDGGEVGRAGLWRQVPRRGDLQQLVELGRQRAGRRDHRTEGNQSQLRLRPVGGVAGEVLGCARRQASLHELPVVAHGRRHLGEVLGGRGRSDEGVALQAGQHGGEEAGVGVPGLGLHDHADRSGTPASSAAMLMSATSASQA